MGEADFLLKIPRLSPPEEEDLEDPAPSKAEGEATPPTPLGLLRG